MRREYSDNRGWCLSLFRQELSGSERQVRPGTRAEKRYVTSVVAGCCGRTRSSLMARTVRTLSLPLAVVSQDFSSVGLGLGRGIFSPDTQVVEPEEPAIGSG